MEGPASSYSSFVIHICWNVESDARIEPPIHTEYLRSGGAMILTWSGLGIGLGPGLGLGFGLGSGSQG